ncbi:MAG: hypothetical protein ACK4I8_02340 [Armatimonadota bacterium]
MARAIKGDLTGVSDGAKLRTPKIWMASLLSRQTLNFSPFNNAI